MTVNSSNYTILHRFGRCWWLYSCCCCCCWCIVFRSANIAGNGSNIILHLSAAITVVVQQLSAYHLLMFIGLCTTNTIHLRCIRVNSHIVCVCVCVCAHALGYYRAQPIKAATFVGHHFCVSLHLAFYASSFGTIPMSLQWHMKNRSEFNELCSSVLGTIKKHK